MKTLIDSDVLIGYFKNIPKDVAFLQNPNHKLYVSTITIAEILEGLIDQPQETKRKKGFEAVLKDMTILDIDKKVAYQFAKVRANLRKIGKLIDNMDLFIASTAITHNLTLVTKNQKHFTSIPNLKITYPY